MGKAKNTLWTVSKEGLNQHCCAKRFGNLKRVVLRARVHDHDIVTDRFQRKDAVSNVGFFVKSDHETTDRQMVLGVRYVVSFIADLSHKQGLSRKNSVR